MTGIGWRPPAAAHAPSTVHGVPEMPAVLFRELLGAQVRDHRLDLRFPTRTPRPAQRADCERSGVVRIIRKIGIGDTQHARARVVPYERNGAINLRARKGVNLLGNFEQRLQYEWRERLAGAQQAIGVAV